MMRRVDMGSNLSESVMVKDRYEACIEEHLGVSNRKLLQVDLDGATPLLSGQYMFLLLRSRSYI